MSSEAQEMKFLRTEYSRSFWSEFSREPFQNEVLEIGMRNTKGGLWIIGGFVSKLVARSLYDFPKSWNPIDIDFIADEIAPHQDPYVPNGWAMRFTSWGNPYLEKGDLRVELNGLTNYVPLKERRIADPKISHLLQIAPLDIQSIAVDTQRKSLEGELGINAIRRKEVKVNDWRSLGQVVEVSGRDSTKVNLEEFVRRKSDGIGFNYKFDFPPEISGGSGNGLRAPHLGSYV